MTEPTVQVPVSLIESLAKRADLAWANNIARDLRALLSLRTPIAEPPRIEDMAPGTIFTADIHPDLTTCYRTRRFMLRFDGTLVDARSISTNPVTKIDPSTIRDVQPPKDAA